MLFKPGFKKSFLKQVDEIVSDINRRNEMIRINNQFTAETVKLSAAIRTHISEMHLLLKTYTKNPHFQITAGRLLDDLRDLEKNSVPILQ